jgi:hypothetical protein
MLATLLQLKVFSRQTVRDSAQQLLADFVPQSVDDETERVVAELVLESPELIQSLSLELARRVGLRCRWRAETQGMFQGRTTCEAALK